MASETTSVFRLVLTTLFWVTGATTELVPSGHRGLSSRAWSPGGSRFQARRSSSPRARTFTTEGFTKRSRSYCSTSFLGVLLLADASVDLQHDRLEIRWRQPHRQRFQEIVSRRFANKPLEKSI